MKASGEKVAFVESKRYFCPEHGDQWNIVGLEFRVEFPGSLTRAGRTFNKKFCMECWIRMMEKFCQELKEVE